MKILVCGGRNYSNRSQLYKMLDGIHGLWGITEVMHGGASGADSLAAEWANFNLNGSTAYPADWETHGKKAGPIRNSLMLGIGQPDLVVAFEGGRGTADMVSKAKRAGVTVWEVPK